MLTPFLLTILIAQNILNNSDSIEQNFKKVDRLVAAAKETIRNLPR